MKLSRKWKQTWLAIRTQTTYNSVYHRKVTNMVSVTQRLKQIKQPRGGYSIHPEVQTIENIGMFNPRQNTIYPTSYFWDFRWGYQGSRNKRDLLLDSNPQSLYHTLWSSADEYQWLQVGMVFTSIVGQDALFRGRTEAWKRLWQSSTLLECLHIIIDSIKELPESRKNIWIS